MIRIAGTWENEAGCSNALPVRPEKRGSRRYTLPCKNAAIDFRIGEV